MQRRLISAIGVLLLGALAVPIAQHVELGRTGSLKFAVIGDNGNGSRQQYDVGTQMATAGPRFRPSSSS